jgi:hypothetical protein
MISKNRSALLLMVALVLSVCSYAQAKLSVHWSESVVDFGAVHLNGSASHKVAVKNNGTSPVVLTSAGFVRTLSKDSSIVTEFGAVAPAKEKVLWPGETAEFILMFFPKVVGAREAKLLIEFGVEKDRKIVQAITCRGEGVN